MSNIKGFIGETLIYGLGNVFSRLFAMFLIPFYAKYLGKIDYSNIVMLQSLFTILTFFLVLTSGVYFYYYEYDNAKYRKIVLSSWFYYELVISIILSLCLILLSPILTKFFIVNSINNIQVKWAIVLVGLQLFPYIINNTNITYFRIEREPKHVVLIVLLEAFLTLVFVFLSLSAFKLGIIGVLLAQISARTIVSISFFKYALLYVKIKNFSLKLLKKIFLYSWPFVISSIFTWIIISIDKFVGAQTLIDKTEVALLALAMQLTLPMTVLADMIRMALGPYVMSIRKEANSEKTYQQIFDLTMFAASISVIGIVLVSPLLVLILANSSYMLVLTIIPLMTLAKLFSLAANQFSISFNLVKKNIYILYAVILAGIVNTGIIYGFMQKFGFIVSGYSQIISYLIMAIFLYYFGRKIANLKLNLKNSFYLLGILIIYQVCLIFINDLIINGSYLIFIILSLICLLGIVLSYMHSQKLNLKMIINFILRKKYKI